MGKKSKRTGKNKQSDLNSAQANTQREVGTATATATATAYPSDGPSEEEINSLQTSSPSLQAKLDQLTNFALADNRKEFVENFVPLDLSPADTAAYLEDLTTAPESDGQWKNLISEIAAISEGRGVNRIEGDQATTAVFFFQHPIFNDCDREVSFVCTRGEWRAEG